ncbi:tail fiber assembly protein [Aeromonas veronii]|uniref:tail fiber assembly protein n=1 Tax=Aeromonas veronii TaxID=654 RepID=UPI00207CFA22|nr:tail fiber assembly protein [Aeromonas veronii]
MHLIILNERGFADESGYVKCHAANPITSEYEGDSVEFISQHTGLPGWARLTGPAYPAPAGFCWILSCDGADDDWELTEDHRGKIAYKKTSAMAMEITLIGPIDPEFTLLAPTTIYDRWDDQAQAWVLDKELEQRKKLEAAQVEQSTRIANATQQIAIIKPAVDGGYAKPEHTKLLADWQRYLYELTLVPEQHGWPDNPQLPIQPATVI